MPAANQNDINLLYQPQKQIYIRLYLMNRNFQTIEQLEGEVTEGSVTIDANSDIRRVASFTFAVKNKNYAADKNSNIWLDKYVDLQIGFYYNRGKQILWYPLGIYIFNENGFRYDSASRTVSCSCVDAMAYFTGLRAGTLRGQATVIPYGSVVANVVRDTVVQLGGVQNFVITENSNPDYLTVPHDLEFGTGVTVYEILRKIADIYPAAEFYFDTANTFRWDYIPTATDDIVLYDDGILSPLVISESLNNSFGEVKNCIEVWGKDDISARLILVDEMPEVPEPEYNYKVNPESPYTVEKVGEIWEVKHGGEYAAIYSEQLALDRCKYELFLSTSAQDRLSLNLMLIPFMGVNEKISYTTKNDGRKNQYITKKINFNLTAGVMSLDCIRFTPLYSWL